MRRARQQPEHDKGEQPKQGETRKDAIFLGDDREDEICVRVGQGRFDGAFARTAAQEAAFGKRTHGPVDLAQIAWQRIEKAIDAKAHMGKCVVGGKQSARCRNANQHRAPHRLARGKELRRPYRQHQHSLADIGLRYQQAGQHTQERHS